MPKYLPVMSCTISMEEFTAPRRLPWWANDYNLFHCDKRAAFYHITKQWRFREISGNHCFLKKEDSKERANEFKVYAWRFMGEKARKRTAIENYRRMLAAGFKLGLLIMNGDTLEYNVARILEVKDKTFTEI